MHILRDTSNLQRPPYTEARAGLVHCLYSSEANSLQCLEAMVAFIKDKELIKRTFAPYKRRRPLQDSNSERDDILTKKRKINEEIVTIGVD